MLKPTLKPTLVDEYFNYHIEYTSKYGKNTVILMQVGSFYEIYSVNNKTEQIGNATEVSQLLNIQLTKKNKNIHSNDRKNPLMTGFPMNSLDKYLQVLLNHNYTSVMVDQIESNDKNIIRKVTNIYSAGSVIPNDSNKYYTISIYIEKIKSKIMIGISSINIISNEVISFEYYLDNNSEFIDSLYTFIKCHNPNEIIIHLIGVSEVEYSDGYFISNLDIQNILYHIYRNNVSKDYLNIDFQNAFLSKVYNNNTMLSTIEYLNLERKPFVIISLVVLLDFIYNHNELMLLNISKPILYDNTKHIKLFNNTLEQLNIFNNVRGNTSIFNIINKTITCIGKRYLQDTLIFPINDPIKLNLRYSQIDYCNTIPDNVLLNIYKCLENILDLEKMHRKLSLGILNPCDFTSLHIGWSSVSNIILLLPSDNLINVILDINELHSFMDSYISIFNLETMSKCNNLDSTYESFFNIGIFSNIDDYQKNISLLLTDINNIASELSLLISNDPNLIKVVCNGTEYSITTTNTRANLLKKKINQDFQFITSKNSCKIISDIINNKIEELIDLKNKLKVSMTSTYIDIIKKIYNDNSTLLKNIIIFIGTIDATLSNFKVAKEFKFVKPIIATDSDNSFLNIKELRHPLIENIQTNTRYIPNDISLNPDINSGLILYGMNASGKCHAENEIILMFDGTTKLVQDIKVNDKLMGNDNTVRNVLSLVNGYSMLYKVSNFEGDVYIVNGDHLLCLRHIPSTLKTIISVNDFMCLPLKKQREYTDYKCNALNFNIIKNNKKLYIKPYVMGLFLGSKKWDFDVIPSTLHHFLKEYNCYLFNNNFITYSDNKINKLFVYLLQNNLLDKKTYHVPDEYKTSSIMNRIDFLSGILECSIKVGEFYKFYGKSILLNDIIFIARSIGVFCKKNTDENYILLCPKYHCTHKPIHIEKFKYGSYYGFNIDNNQEYIMGNFVITHNSSFIKSVGIATIMAQSGMFVPASEMTLSPYSNIITRISSSDNILKGHSSFVVEMMELRNILNNSNNKTLVIMDELCKGTETISANSIVSASLLHLLKKNVSFVIATHLRFLSQYKPITDTIQIKHLSVNITESNIIYNRLLLDGPGDELYGLEVAKYLDLDKDFINSAYNIRNYIINKKKEVLSSKKSKYNSKKNVDKCEICSYYPKNKLSIPLHTHHINFQCDADSDGYHNIYHKNTAHNLVILCKDCHEKVHSNLIEINGYMSTAKGIILDLKKN